MQIRNEKGLEGLYKYCDNDKEASLFINDGLKSCYLSEKQLIFCDEEIAVPLTLEQIGFFSDYKNGDVFDLSSSGIVFPLFKQKSGDNTFYVTDKCNSNCIMCPVAESIRKNGLEVIPDRLWDLVHYIPANLEHVTITGGEPFLAKEEMFRILEALKYKCLSTEFLLLSNGRAFSIDGYAEKLKDTAPSRFSIGIPIHGHNALLHDKISQANGSFDQTFLGIKNLQKNGIDVEIRIVVNAINAQYINDIAMMISHDFSTVSSVKIMAMEMLGNAAKNLDEVWLPYDSFFEAVKQAVDTLVKGKIDVAIYNMPLCLVKPEYWHICKQSISDYKIRFFEKCEKCSVRDACGGVFAGTYRMLEDSVKPII